VWSHRTTPSKATGFTPFFLIHGAEAVLPMDLEYGSPRVRGYDEDANQQAREDSLVLTQNVHLAPSTQQAEQAGFTRAKSHETCQSIFPEN
jgi:hypothetical protein